jgi:AcrR family transcriptional regulator
VKPDGIRRVRAARTLHTIIDTAKALFDEHGYEDVTLRRIAKAAGVSTGAIFANYDGKAALYRDVYGHDPITPEQGRRLADALRRLGNDPAPILQAA